MLTGFPGFPGPVGSGSHRVLASAVWVCLVLMLACGRRQPAGFEQNLDKLGKELELASRQLAADPSSPAMASHAARLRQLADSLSKARLPETLKVQEQLLELQRRKVVRAAREFEQRCRTGIPNDIRQAFEILADQYESLRSLVDSRGSPPSGSP